MKNTIWRHDIPLLKEVPEKFSVIVETKKDYFDLMRDLEDLGYHWGRCSGSVRSSSSIWGNLTMPEYINIYSDGGITYSKPDNPNLKTLEEVYLYVRKID